ncbi:hypothetical protein H6F88_30395 [Oculatella sp. FACHB-28]|uniref:hypothetical protein n=1 Tax=Oculatella sp. FACHB-28 TaxID=2692845 RepID=UPI001684A7C5|nr:hypothetical protein [Oculatella sp. FACHB-28]MBD2060258.1 hypothetical protein [Oculatella sp. FACHB-28]
MSKFVLPSLKWTGFLALLATLGVAPALAQSANFDSLTLSPGFSSADGTVQGYTQGSFSLSSIANRDRSENLCVGFADTTPDHILVLQQDFSQLTLQVNSGGGDTTLLVQGPSDSTVRCGDDTGRTNTDASIQDSSWQAGTYKVWVGAFESGSRHEYTLTVRE